MSNNISCMWASVSTKASSKEHAETLLISFNSVLLASCVKNLVSVRNCRELSHYRCDLQEQITQGCFELPPNIPRLCRSACWRCSRTHASITTYDCSFKVYPKLPESRKATFSIRIRLSPHLSCENDHWKWNFCKTLSRKTLFSHVRDDGRKQNFSKTLFGFT